MSHRKLYPVATAAALVLLVAACTSSPTATPRPTQTSVQATAATTTQATEESAATTEATVAVPTSVATTIATAEAQSVVTEEATVETAMTTSEAPVGTTVAMATMEVMATTEPMATMEVTTVAMATTEPMATMEVMATTEPMATMEVMATTEPMATMEVTTVAMATTEPMATMEVMATTEPMATMAATAEVVATTAATVEPVMTVEATAEATPTGPQTFADSDPSDGGITFVYPEGVVLTGGDSGAILTVEGGVVNIYPPATYAQVIGGQTFASDAEALAFFADRIGLTVPGMEEPAAEATAAADATAEAAATTEAVATVEAAATEAADAVTGELARVEVELERREQAGTAYLIDVGGGEKAVIVWLTAVGTEPSPALVDAFTSVVDTLTFTPAPPPPTEEAPVVEATAEATAAATAEPMATMAATAEAMATMEATSAAEMPASVVDVAMSSPDFSTLVNAVVAADLVEALSDASADYTVFAPTNAAFEEALAALDLTAEELLGNKELLTTILTYHVVPSRVLSTELEAGEVTTLQGEAVTISLEGGTVMVNDATVTTADIESGNGVVHVIDKVLLPPSLNN